MIVYIYQLVRLDNIFHDRICYTKKPGVMKSIQFSQRYSELLLPWQKQGNYPVIPIYVPSHGGCI